MGTNDQVDHNLPTLVPFNSDVVVDIACGVLHTAVLTQTGDVYLSGSNRRGQVGNGQISDPFTSFSMNSIIGASASAAKTVAAIAAGSYHTMALTINGAVWCWGDASFGQTGANNPQVSVDTVPKNYNYFSGQVVKGIASSSYTSYAVLSTGAMYSW